MTDRELLERAAKAAGMSVLTVPWPRDPDGWFYCEHGSDGGGMFYAKGQQARGGRWNPLEDDGDALRLAVTRRIRIHPYDTFVAASCGVRRCMVESYHRHRDERAATRRAIVRAAAAMADAGEER